MRSLELILPTDHSLRNVSCGVTLCRSCPDRSFASWRVREGEMASWGEVAKAAFSSGFTVSDVTVQVSLHWQRLNRKEKRQEKEINNYSTLIERYCIFIFLFLMHPLSGGSPFSSFFYRPKKTLSGRVRGRSGTLQTSPDDHYVSKSILALSAGNTKTGCLSIGTSLDPPIYQSAHFLILVFIIAAEDRLEHRLARPLGF